LCQLTADLTGRVVLTGPVETTAIGNLACQFVALGTFGGAKQAREVVSRSFGVERFDPSASAAGEGTYRRWLAHAR
jgi:rhamnulokinase